jgi:uncharacterized RDD family membrane protein YckC
MSAPAETPAGFWRRYAAWSLDWLLLGAPLALLLAPLIARALAQWQALRLLLDDWVYARVVAADGLPSPLAMALELLQDRALGGQLHAAMLRLDATLGLLLVCVLGAGTLYFVGFEASPLAATPGKWLARLRVRAADDTRLPPGRVLVRHFAGALSWMLLNLGHAIAGWRADRRALHDLIAGAQVRAQGPLPAWARGWLLVQLSLLLALLLGLLGWLGWLLWQLAAML